MNDAEREAILRAVPQRLVGRMLGGRQTVHLQRMADRWSFPIDGKTVDLFAVMSRLWSFLKQYGPMLQVLMEDTGDQEDDSLGVRYLRAKIAKTEEDARAAAIRNDLRQNTLIERERVHEVFERLVNVVRKSSDRAQARWGQEGFDFVAGLIDGFEDEIRGVKDGLADPQSADAET